MTKLYRSIRRFWYGCLGTCDGGNTCGRFALHVFREGCEKHICMNPACVYCQHLQVVEIDM